METNEIQSKPVNPWKPMTNSKDIRVINKLQEELGELVSALARCQIQGIEESHPETGKLNKEWLQDEVADVYACISILRDHFQLYKGEIASRINRKLEYLKRWLDES